MDFARPSQSIAATILSGLVLCNPAFAQNAATSAARSSAAASPAVVTADAGGVSGPGDIQQVVGKQFRRRTRSSSESSSTRSGGFLSGLFGRGSSDEDKVVPTPAGELQGGNDDVNWDGVPYHSVRQSNSRTSTPRSQSAATPIRNQSSGSANSQPRSTAVSTTPTRTPTRTAGGLQIPQPPADSVASRTPGFSGESSRRSATSGLTASNSVEDDNSLSMATSSRRSGRRVVTTTRPSGTNSVASDNGGDRDESAASVSSVARPDYSGVEDLVPRVKRRTIAANGSPATSGNARSNTTSPSSAAIANSDATANRDAPTNAVAANSAAVPNGNTTHPPSSRRATAAVGSPVSAPASPSSPSAKPESASANANSVARSELPGRSGELAGSGTEFAAGDAAGQFAANASAGAAAGSVAGPSPMSRDYPVATTPPAAGRAENEPPSMQSAAGQRYQNLGFVGNGSSAVAAKNSSVATLPNRSVAEATRPRASYPFAADPFQRNTPEAIPTADPNDTVATAEPSSQPTATQLPDSSNQFQSPYRTASAPIGSGLSATESSAAPTAGTPTAGTPTAGTATAALPTPPAGSTTDLSLQSAHSGPSAMQLPAVSAGQPAASIALAAPIAGSFNPKNMRMNAGTNPAVPAGMPSTGLSANGPVLRDQMSTQHWNDLPAKTSDPKPTVHNQGRPANDPASLADNVMRNETVAGPKELATDQNAVSSEMPGIRVTTAGPQWMMIRQTREYQIRVENRGAIDAEGVLVRTMIPNWAELQGNATTVGDVQRESTDSEERLVWTIDKLPAGTNETLTVRLNAARSGTYHMNVNWTLMPRKTVTNIEVREPKLRLSIDGPDEVVYGQSATYQVRILNPGDGVAPNVMFILSPDTAPQTQRIGDIPPGKEAQFDVELTAQDLKDLKVKGLATGDLDLRTEAGKTIKVLSAKLNAELSGPEVKYQDSEAMYGLTISNNGTADSESIAAQLKLPAGVEYISGIEAAKQFGRVLKWNIASMPVDTAIDYEFRCLMKSTGDQAFAFDAHGTAAGATGVSLITSVESISDLVLSIKDPPAPAPIGSEVTYEIAIRNRGSRAAKQVRAVAQFSNGIEPKRILGQTGQMVTGQVLFDSIPSIGPGEEVTLKVIAIAETGGHHRFRSEVTSGEVVLVAEEATHYMSGNSQRVSRRSETQIR